MKFFQQVEHKLMTTISKIRHTDKGFTLVEAIAGLVIFLVVATFMMPMFANQRLSSINNEIKTGAIAVSQQVLDELRQVDIVSLKPSATTPYVPSDRSAVLASGDDVVSKSVMGKPYKATISYCPDGATDIYCNSNARHIKVQVSYNAQVIYTVETVYTRF